MASILEYLPAPLTVIREFSALASAEDPELASLWSALDDAFKDQFIDEATATGVRRWEEQLRISPKAGSTLAERKSIVRARISEQLPYTYRVLDRRLATLCGEDGFTLAVDAEAQTVTVRVELSSAEVYDDVVSLLDGMVPANMVLDVSLLYNQYSLLQSFSHSALSAYTHQQLREQDI